LLKDLCKKYDLVQGSPTWKGGDEFSSAEEGVVALFCHTQITSVINSHIWKLDSKSFALNPLDKP
jgi:hypothetical protein